jgi:hypothetical protein
MQAVLAFMVWLITAIAAYIAGGNKPPTPHTCPTGQHWDEPTQKCVADTPEPPLPGPPNPGSDDLYVDCPTVTPVETLVLAYEGTETPIGTFKHTANLPGGVYLDDTYRAAIDLAMYKGWIAQYQNDAHDNRYILLIGDQETATARYNATHGYVTTKLPKFWYESAKKGDEGYGARIIILERR